MLTPDAAHEYLLQIEPAEAGDIADLVREDIVFAQLKEGKSITPVQWRTIQQSIAERAWGRTDEHDTNRNCDLSQPDDAVLFHGCRICLRNHRRHYVFNWNIASQVRELRDETNARLSDLERRVLQQQSSEEQRIVEAIKARADVANAMREDQ